MAAISIKVKGVSSVINTSDAIAAAATDLRKPNNIFGQRLRRNAINRLDQRTIKDRVTTGALARSIQTVNDAQKGRVFTNLVYARVQQEGGTIKAKNKKYLAIPNPKNTALRRSGKWPRDFPKGTFNFITSEGGNGLLVWAEKLGKGKRRKGKLGSQIGEVAFILRRYVRIPQRRYLLATEEDTRFYADQILRHVTEAADKASGKGEDNG